MELECTCMNINEDRWNELMKGKKRISYKWLVNKIKKKLPCIYEDLCLQYYNPWKDNTYSTKTHYVLTHSAIEYFFRK